MLSKYTTEVRFICEKMCGLSQSDGYDKVDYITSNSWNKIFTYNFPIFDENYRCILCKKILKHFYTREICCETVGLWMLWLNERMETIMPYYNQLYNSELIKFNPLHNTDLITTSNNTTTQTENKKTQNTNKNLYTGNGTRDNNDTLTANSKSINYKLESDTPQGGLDGIESNNYLTRATKDTNDDSSSQTNIENVKYADTKNTDNIFNESADKNFNNIDDYIQHISGNNGSESFSNLLLNFRKTFLNIDNMIMDELSDLFFNLW